jgi:23S rRNA (adenine2503-C2)-methyltransferase
LEDGAVIETVLLRDGKDRKTACLSSQAGCHAGCVFCKTGAFGFTRNLTAEEIVSQFLHLKRKENEISHIVIMGMGEPLLNLQELRQAIDVLNDKSGLNISRRRITVSTCGICDSLFEIANNLPFARLALSLTTADEILRQKLMPVCRNNPLEKVKQALLIFQKNGGGRVTLEIPLLGGINTRDKDIECLAVFAKGFETVVNIIPWNPVKGLMFEGREIREPEKNEITAFILKLEERGLKVTVRNRKGRSVLGACGQLGTL